MSFPWSGLYFGHAYSLLRVGELEDVPKGKKTKLVQLRNPWGKMEYTGAFSDHSDEREKYDDSIKKCFPDHGAEKTEMDMADGIFFMTFTDWMKYFTNLFVALPLPKGWEGQRSKGKWKAENGGNRKQATWFSNPTIKVKFPKDCKDRFRQVFVGLYIYDLRLTKGKEYFKDPLYSTPLTFDIVTEKELKESADFGIPLKGEVGTLRAILHQITSFLITDDPMYRPLIPDLPAGASRLSMRAVPQRSSRPSRLRSNGCSKG